MIGLSRLKIALMAGSASGAAFSPASLFAASEVGVWYDPSDFSTMFQDTAGTVPVTAVGQSVARINDKSGRGNHATQGNASQRPVLRAIWDGAGALGSELVTNGDFASGNTSGWTVGASLSAAVVSGRVNVTRAGSINANSAFRQDVATTAGKVYIVTVDVITNNGAARNFTDSTGAGLAGVGSANISGTGTFTYYVVATDSVIRLNFWTDDATTSTFDNISVKELPASSSRYYLEFDGSDDFLQTSAIDFSATDEMTVVAGVRKLTNGTTSCVVEIGTDANTVNGSFAFFAPSGGSRYIGIFNGSAPVYPATTSSAYDSPITNVVAFSDDISIDYSVLRINGSQVDSQNGNQGTGNFGNHALYIGRRGGTSLPFKGYLYGLIVRGKTTDAATLTSTETWMNSKTGAY